MPLKNFDTLTFPDLILLRGTFVEPGTLPWLLSEHHRLLFPEWLFKGWKGERKVGREAWPAPRLMAMLLLRHSEAGMTRVGAVRKANTDAAWRTALRLPWLYFFFNEKTCREFEAFMKSPHPDVNRPRIELAFEHWARLGIEDGIARRRPGVGGGLDADVVLRRRARDGPSHGAGDRSPPLRTPPNSPHGE